MAPAKKSKSKSKSKSSSKPAPKAGAKPTARAKATGSVKAKAGASKATSKTAGKKPLAKSATLLKGSMKGSSGQKSASKTTKKVSAAGNSKTKTATKTSGKSSGKSSGKVNARSVMKAAAALVTAVGIGKLAQAARTKVSSGAHKGGGKVIPLRKPAAKVSMENVFSPLDDRVLIERLGASERTAGGLFIPDMVQERPNEGRVIAVGPGLRDKKGRLRPLDVQIGDKVMFQKWAGSEISIFENELTILRESDIIGVL